MISGKAGNSGLKNLKNLTCIGNSIAAAYTVKKKDISKNNHTSGLAGFNSFNLLKHIHEPLICAVKPSRENNK